MTETFPRKPLLDRIIVREIPIAEFYEQPQGIEIDLDNSYIKERSDRGVVVAVGDCVPMGAVTLPMPIAVDDVVFFDEFALSDPVFLNPAHKNRNDLPKYFQMRVSDLKGVDVANRNRIVDEFEAQRADTDRANVEAKMQAAGMHVVGTVQ